MKEKAEEQAGDAADKAKWIAALLLVSISIYGNHFYSDAALLYRVVGILCLTLFALVIASTTHRGRSIISMFRDAQIEIKKVVWPNKQETTQTTLVVLGVVILMALLLWGLDTFFGYIISGFIG